MAQCVEVALIDDAGKPILSNGLVTGMVIGDAPVFIAEMPPHRERRVIGPVACPADLTREVTNLYNLSCTSETARRQAAETNGTSLDIILQRCEDMNTALTAGN
jgi:hypothetical protein